MAEVVKNMMDISVLTQCLDFTKQLINSKTAFKFDLKFPNGFSFNFTTMDQEPIQSRKCDIKKKSPSTLRRNAMRKQKFLEEKKISSKLPESSFKCDQCDFESNCKVILRKHILKEHKLIPQLDGLTDNEIVEKPLDVSSQMEDSMTKEAINSSFENKDTQADDLEPKSTESSSLEEIKIKTYNAKRIKPSPDEVWRNVCSRIKW